MTPERGAQRPRATLDYNYTITTLLQDPRDTKGTGGHTGRSRETPEGPEGTRGMQEAPGGPGGNTGGSERAVGLQGSSTRFWTLYRYRRPYHKTPTGELQIVLLRVASGVGVKTATARFVGSLWLYGLLRPPRCSLRSSSSWLSVSLPTPRCALRSSWCLVSLCPPVPLVPLLTVSPRVSSGAIGVSWVLQCR